MSDSTSWSLLSVTCTASSVSSADAIASPVAAFQPFSSARHPTAESARRARRRGWVITPGVSAIWR
jgi:hypothetical protein